MFKMIGFFLLILGPMGTQGEGPHTVYLLTWQVISQTGETVWKKTGQYAPNTWWPPLTPDFCQLAAGLATWDVPIEDPTNSEDNLPRAKRAATEVSSSGGPIQTSPGCRDNWAKDRLASLDFYVCPKDDRSRDKAYACGGYEQYFCAQWTCETTGDAYWNPSSSWDKIIVKRGWVKNGAGTTSLPLNITVTDKGKQALEWQKGYTWGLRWHMSGTDKGVIFKIQLKVKTAAIPIDPNQVLTNQRLPSVQENKELSIDHNAPPVMPSPPRTHGSTPIPTAALIQEGTGDRLLNLMEGTYLALNYTNPDKTQDCWLCLVSGSPYYEGIAIMGNYTNHTKAPSQCTSIPRHRLTLSEVSGEGYCIGAVPPSHQRLCRKIDKLTSTGFYYLVAPTGTYWACSTGLTPCISAALLDKFNDYCVLIELWPKVIYHTSEDFYSHYERRPRYRREPVSITVALLLGGITVGGMAAGIGTGAIALTETRQFRQLQLAMNTDIQALEESISALEKSLTSLSEVVLQNRRGLDILFLKEGGLCAALKEECCFYADHTGLVRDSMAKLRERLKNRQQIVESQQGWFEGWYNRSPWFTTLISTIMGPMIIILLIFLFGPCILNRLVQFIKDRLAVMQAFILTLQYQPTEPIYSDF